MLTPSVYDAFNNLLDVLCQLPVETTVATKLRDAVQDLKYALAMNQGRWQDRSGPSGPTGPTYNPKTNKPWTREEMEQLIAKNG